MMHAPASPPCGMALLPWHWQLGFCLFRATLPQATLHGVGNMACCSLEPGYRVIVGLTPW
jgi:hypothetical protein